MDRKFKCKRTKRYLNLVFTYIFKGEKGKGSHILFKFYKASIPIHLLGFGCNGVQQFHMVSVSSRMDLLLIGHHHSPKCRKKKHNTS